LLAIFLRLSSGTSQERQADFIRGNGRVAKAERKVIDARDGRLVIGWKIIWSFSGAAFCLSPGITSACFPWMGSAVCNM